jgi:hypothetical protein
MVNCAQRGIRHGLQNLLVKRTTYSLVLMNISGNGQGTWDFSAAVSRSWRQAATAALIGRSSSKSKSWAAQAAPSPVIKPTPKEPFNDFGSNRNALGKHVSEATWCPTSFLCAQPHENTLVNANKWRLRIEGSGIQKPMELTYEGLLSLPSVSVIRYVSAPATGAVSLKRRMARKRTELNGSSEQSESLSGPGYHWPRF